MTDCEVLVIESNRRLSYSWNASGSEAVNGLKTVVTWTLTRTANRTFVRIEQSGFRPEDERNYQGADYRRQRYLTELEQVIAKLE